MIHSGGVIAEGEPAQPPIAVTGGHGIRPARPGLAPGGQQDSHVELHFDFLLFSLSSVLLASPRRLLSLTVDSFHLSPESLHRRPVLYLGLLLPNRVAIGLCNLLIVHLLLKRKGFFPSREAARLWPQPNFLQLGLRGDSRQGKKSRNMRKS